MDDTTPLAAKASSKEQSAEQFAHTQTQASIANELAEIREREATSRLKAAREFVRFRDELEKLRARLDQKENDREALVVELESFTRLLAAAEDEKISLGEKVARMQTSLSWTVTQPWRALTRIFRPKPNKAGLPQSTVGQSEDGFVYYFYTTPFRIYRTDTVRLRGWIFSRKENQIKAVRASVDDQVFAARYDLEENEVVRVHGPLPQNPRPGFEVEIAVPTGRHELKFEALLGERDWRSFFRAPIWRS